MTFLEITNYILEASRRPEDFRTTAKLCVNLAVKEATKLNAFSCLMDFADVTYSASTETIVWSTVISDADALRALYVLSDSGEPATGVKILSYERLLGEELPTNDNFLTPTPTSVTTCYKAFVIGDKLGLYPKPSQDTEIRVIYLKKLTYLVDETDTNVLLENVPELVINLALQKLNSYLQEDERFPISEKQIQRSLMSAQQWDNNYATYNGIDWPL